MTTSIDAKARAIFFVANVIADRDYVSYEGSVWSERVSSPFRHYAASNAGFRDAREYIRSLE